MKKLFVSFLALVSLVSCNSYGFITLSGISVEKRFEERASYSSLEISNAIAVTYSDTATAVTVYADSSVMDYVNVDCKAGALKLYLDCPLKVNMGNTGKIKATVPASSMLESVSVSGASSFRSEKPLSCGSFRVSASGASAFSSDLAAETSVSIVAGGASKVRSAIDAERLEVDLSGASDADLSGKVSSYSLTASGASSVSSGKSNVETDTLECSLSGASNGKVRCNVSAAGHVSGASSLTVYGESNVKVSESGASKVVRR